MCLFIYPSIQQNVYFVELTEDEQPFEIPTTWKLCNLEDITYILSSKNNQIKQNEILETGKFPVISQSLKTIEGYCDDATKLIENPNVILVFGDHSKTLKYIDFNFIVGADGTKLIVPFVINPMYLYYHLQYNLVNFPKRNYGRHYSLLKDKYISLPPLEEQERIVKVLNDLLPLCEAL